MSEDPRMAIFDAAVFAHTLLWKGTRKPTDWLETGTTVGVG
jgi:hypothetical protein